MYEITGAHEQPNTTQCDTFITPTTLALVGAPASPHPSSQVMNLILKRRSIAGSMIGGIAETQEMLDFCAEHGIVADIEQIRADEINEAYERMLRGDVKYRFVIDTSTI